MASINASTAGVGGIITTADNTGNLNIQSGGSTKIAVTSAGANIVGTFTVNGAAPAYGKVLQVVQATSSYTSTTSTSFVTTGQSLAITPIGTNSKFLIHVSHCSQLAFDASQQSMAVAIRSSLDSYAANLRQYSAARNPSSWTTLPSFLQLLHSPSVSAGTTITYATYFKSTYGTTVYFADIWNSGDTAAVITIMEIAA